MGVLIWQDTVIYDDFSVVGKIETLGKIIFNLTEVRSVSNAKIYTSTATLNNAMEDTTLNCADGLDAESRTVKIKSKL